MSLLKYNNKLLALSLWLLLPSLCQAGLMPRQRSAFERALKDIQRGRYALAASQLDAMKASAVEVTYWSAVSHFGLQAFPVAEKKFQQVLSKDKKNRFPESAYYLGQTLYAQRKYPEAIKAFQISADRSVQIAPSLYYQGYLQFLLKQRLDALLTLKKVIQLQPVMPRWQQTAQFQIGEILFVDATQTQGAETRRDIGLNQAIPAYQRAIAFDPETPLASHAQSRISEIRRLIGQNTSSEKPWSLSFNQDFKFDTNIYNQSDDSPNKESYTGSGFSRTAVFGRYEWGFQNGIAVAPEFGIDFTYHQRRDVPAIYGNDNANFNPALRTRLDHLIRERPGSLTFEYEYSHGLRDYLKNNTQPQYGTSHNLILGERVSLLKTGPTSLTFNVRQFKNASNDGLSNVTPGVSLSQSFTLSPRQVLSTSFNFEMQNANLSVFDQKSYRFGLATGFSTLPGKLNLDLAFALTFVDTMEQQSSRGTEINLMPTVTLSRYLDSDRHLLANFSYVYMRNFSKETQDYQFSKHVLGIGLGVAL